MQIEELWALHEKLSIVLAAKLNEAKDELDKRLVQLTIGIGDQSPLARKPHTRRAKRVAKKRRPYPRVFPKYQNPSRPFEKWSGRGRQPRWLVAQLKTGKRIEDFEIRPRKNDE